MWARIRIRIPLIADAEMVIVDQNVIGWIPT
jgi:hypothetical protein